MQFLKKRQTLPEITRLALLATVVVVGMLTPKRAVGQTLGALVFEVGHDDEVVFQRIVDMVGDGEGDLFVLDGGQHRIVRIKSDGRIVGTFGGQGQGPGEMMRPSDIFLRGDSIGVVDLGTGRVTFFSKNGEVLHSDPMQVLFGGLAGAAQPIPTGEWILEPAVVAPVGRTLSQVPVVVFSGEGRDTLAVYHTATIRVQLRDEPVSPFPIGPSVFGAGGYWAASSEGVVTVVSGRTGERTDYERASNGSWSQIRVTQLPLEAIPVTEDDLSKARAKVATLMRPYGYSEREIKVFTPEVKSALLGMFYDDDGGLWVQPRDVSEGSAEWIFVGSSGEVSRIGLPVDFEPLGSARGRIFGIHTDEYDVQSVRSYTISGAP